MSDKERDDPFLVTNYLDPEGKINSEYGIITNREWLKEEKLRIGNCRITHNSQGFIALTRKKGK